MKILYSDRNLPIILSTDTIFQPTISVELYDKWYNLQLIHTDLTVKSINFPELNLFYDSEPNVCDHCPNPKTVREFANRNNFQIDNLAYELIVGRWNIEYRELY